MAVEPAPSGINQTQQYSEGGIGAIWFSSLLGATHHHDDQSGAPPSSPISILLLGLLTLLTLTYITYHQALPKPLPGIPYNTASAGRLLGDLPELIALVKAGDLRGFFAGMTTRLDSPIVQFFGRPFSRPTLIISDFRTTQDILLRRTGKEFDRPLSQIATLRGVIRHHHISMLTSDPQFRRNRALVKDLMTPQFLHAVNAPEIWRNAVHFVDLWKWKAQVAEGRAFEAAQDVGHMTFDIIKNVAVGRDGRTMMEVYFDELKSDFDIPGTKKTGNDSIIEFPKPPRDDTLEAQHRMNKALTPGLAVPMQIFHAINNRRPYMREAYASKEKMLRRQVDLAVARHEASEPLDSALDFMIRREMGAAQKEGRAPVFDSPAMFDECKFFNYSSPRVPFVLCCVRSSPWLEMPRTKFTNFIGGHDSVWLSRRRPRHHSHDFRMGPQTPRQVPRGATANPCRPPRRSYRSAPARPPAQRGRNYQDASSLPRGRHRGDSATVGSR